MTRVLIVTANKPGSSRKQAEQFARFIKDAFKDALRQHEKVEFVQRKHTELAEFLPPSPSSAFTASAPMGTAREVPAGGKMRSPWT